jgi:hypothetical protein
LWGDRPGQKYKKEGWEGMMFWGFGGGFVVATIAYVYKPDTRYVLVMEPFYVLDWLGRDIRT